MCYSAFCVEYEYIRISLINNIIIYNIFIEKSGSFGGGFGKKQMINRIKNITFLKFEEKLIEL